MSEFKKTYGAPSCEEIVSIDLPLGETGCVTNCPDPQDGLDPEMLEKLCEILEALQMPVGIELGSIEVGCITDAEGVVTGKVYMCIVKDEQNTTTTTELKAVSYADGSITSPYTGPISPCSGTCPDEAPLGVITDLSQL